MRFVFRNVDSNISALLGLRQGELGPHSERIPVENHNTWGFLTCLVVVQNSDRLICHQR